MSPIRIRVPVLVAAGAALVLTVGCATTGTNAVTATVESIEIEIDCTCDAGVGVCTVTPDVYALDSAPVEGVTYEVTWTTTKTSTPGKYEVAAVGSDRAYRKLFRRSWWGGKPTLQQRQGASSKAVGRMKWGYWKQVVGDEERKVDWIYEIKVKAGKSECSVDPKICVPGNTGDDDSNC